MRTVEVLLFFTLYQQPLWADFSPNADDKYKVQLRHKNRKVGGAYLNGNLLENNHQAICMGHIGGESHVILELKSCSDSRLVLSVHHAAEGGVLFIQGSTTKCKHTTTSSLSLYSFSFEQCNIQFDKEFRVVVQKRSNVQTGSDLVIPMLCILDINDIVVQGSLLPGDDLDEKGHNITIRPTARMRVMSYGLDVSSGEVTLGDPMSMEINLDEEFVDDFEIIAQDCSAAMISVVKDGCSNDKELFPNFQKDDSGRLTSEFHAFQPTNIEGARDVDVTYRCLLSVCKGRCDKANCDDTKQDRRKRRNTDEEVDRISCGTTVKVRAPKETSLMKEQETQLCMEKVAAFPIIITTGLVILGSWIIIARLSRKVMIMEGKHDSDMGVARSVGRRISSVFNLPTGYNFRGQNILTTIPEYEGSTPPQQRRKSVTMMRVGYLENQ